MKTALISLFLVLTVLTNASVAQQAPVERVSFTLKNTLGYHQMFRAEGPGIAYGFTMNRNESTPKNWPIGTRLYFSKDGETNGGYILMVTADDAGKTLTTENVPIVASASKPNAVTFKLHNTNLLPKRITLISYEPGQSGNGTNGFMIGPKGSKSFTFPVGTKLYLADSEQVDVVMSGKRIDSGKPFLILKKEDAGKVFDWLPTRLEWAFTCQTCPNGSRHC